MSRKPRILLVDDDHDLGSMVKRMFSQDGIETYYSDNPLKAARLLLQEHYDILMTDMNMPNISGIELILWAKKHAPRTQSIMMTAMPVEAIQAMADQAGVLEIFRKPLDLLEVRQRLTERIQTGLSGRMRQVSLENLLQVLLMDKINREILIEDKTTGHEGQLSLYQGELIHAALFDMEEEELLAEGEEAFYKILKIKNGSFTEKAFNGDLIRNVQTPFQGMVMEAAKQMDEGDIKTLDVSNEYLNNIDKIRRIMLVDDDMIIRVLLQKSLSQQGYEVIEMVSAVEAVKYIESTPDHKLDLIITDVSMPGMSGVEFLLWLKEQQIPVPVIMMTAFHSEEIEQTAKQNKVLRYLNKPIQLKELELLLGEIGNSGFEGYVDNINVFDFIQLALMSGERKKIQVKDQDTGEAGHLYLDQGSFLHAEFQHILGEEAFYKMVTMGKGLFYEKEWTDPPIPSLQSMPAHKLLIGATRLMDEKNAFWPGSESMIAEIEKKVDSGLEESSGS